MSFLKNISDGERRLVVPAVIVTAFLSVLLIVDIPLYRKAAEMERKSDEEKKRLLSVIYMGKEYLSVKNDVADIGDRAFTGEGASLSGIDSIVNKAGLKKKLSSLKPLTTPVTDEFKRIRAELYFEKASLSEIMRLLSAMEIDGHVMTVEKTTLKATYENPTLFNATLVVNTVEKE